VKVSREKKNSPKVSRVEILVLEQMQKSWTHGGNAIGGCPIKREQEPSELEGDNKAMKESEQWEE